MEKKEIYNKLVEGIRKLFPDNKNIDYDKLDYSTRLVEDLKFDSLNLILMSFLIEKEFSVDISQLKINNFSTVQSVIDYISLKL